MPDMRLPAWGSSFLPPRREGGSGTVMRLIRDSSKDVQVISALLTESIADSWWLCGYCFVSQQIEGFGTRNVSEGNAGRGVMFRFESVSTLRYKSGCINLRAYEYVAAKILHTSSHTLR